VSQALRGSGKPNHSRWEASAIHEAVLRPQGVLDQSFLEKGTTFLSKDAGLLSSDWRPKCVPLTVTVDYTRPNLARCPVNEKHPRSVT
jgi:hypothetical protein